MRLLKLINKDKYIKALEKRTENKSHTISKWKKDFFRKLNHVLIFIGLFVVWYVSYNIIRDIIINNDNNNKEIKIDPAITNMLYLYLRLLTTPKSIAQVLFSLEWFYYVLFFFFYIFCLTLLTNELTRKTKNFSFIFNFIPKFTTIFSEEEKKSYCSYLYFSIGQLFASLLCPPMAFFAILGMSSIGDLMSSQIGIRYGKIKISWNHEKTYEGTLAGTSTTFIICLFFIGPFYALIFSLAFFIFDMITTKPLNLNDNLLIPIGCAIIYVFVRYITDIDYFSIVLDFF
jgi:dolichol kinase